MFDSTASLSDSPSAPYDVALMPKRALNKLAASMVKSAGVVAAGLETKEVSWSVIDEPEPLSFAKRLFKLIRVVSALVLPDRMVWS